MLIEELVQCIPEELKGASGKAFHSGRLAFSGQRDLYVLGLNPGGDPRDLSETVETHSQWVLRDAPANWSALLDQGWGRPPGQAPLQRTLVSLLERLGLEPREVPFSDAVFCRSRQARHIPDNETQRLMRQCWRFHRAVIQRLRVRVVLCLYKEASEFVRGELRASRHPSHRVFESSASGRKYWRESYPAPGGLSIIQITRPTGIPWEDNAYQLAELAFGRGPPAGLTG